MNPRNEDERELDHERLMGRIVDGEADPVELERFERLAAAEPSHWRRLAVLQQDQLNLRAGLERAIEPAAQVTLPRPRTRPRLHPARITLPLALSGWAAVLIISVTWTLIALAGQARLGTTATVAEVQTPEEAYELYTHRAPYVVGELTPVVLDVEVLSDGRVAVNFYRRIEEVLLLDPEQELPIDENGMLLTDPVELRRFEPVVRPLEGLSVPPRAD